MKLVAIIENVNQPENEYLIGSIVIVDSELVSSEMDNELCYQEVEHDREFDYFYGENLRRCLNSIANLKHAVNNIEIIGVY